MRPVVIACAVLMALALEPVSAAAKTVVSCPFDGHGADRLERGFYVKNYPGNNIDRVTLAYIPFHKPGTYQITLTLRRGSYAGPIIGTRTVSVSLTNTASTKPVAFAFGGVHVGRGSTITFSQSSTGPGDLDYDTGKNACPGVTETEGTAPPLDTPRRDGVGLTITEVPTPVASGLGVAPYAFAAASTGPTVKPASNKTAAPVGTRVSYTLDTAATVKFSVRESLPGRVKGTHCVRPTAKNQSAKKCKRIVTVGSFSQSGKPGANSFRFTGRIGGKKLKPRKYRLVAVPRANGPTGDPVSTGFRIVK